MPVFWLLCQLHVNFQDWLSLPLNQHQMNGQEACWKVRILGPKLILRSSAMSGNFIERKFPAENSRPHRFVRFLLIRIPDANGPAFGHNEAAGGGDI